VQHSSFIVHTDDEPLEHIFEDPALDIETTEDEGEDEDEEVPQEQPKSKGKGKAKAQSTAKTKAKATPKRKGKGKNAELPDNADDTPAPAPAPAPAPPAPAPAPAPPPPPIVRPEPRPQAPANADEDSAFVTPKPPGQAKSKPANTGRGAKVQRYRRIEEPDDINDNNATDRPASPIPQTAKPTRNRRRAPKSKALIINSDVEAPATSAEPVIPDITRPRTPQFISSVPPDPHSPGDYSSDLTPPPSTVPDRLAVLKEMERLQNRTPSPSGTSKKRGHGSPGKQGPDGKKSKGEGSSSRAMDVDEDDRYGMDLDGEAEGHGMDFDDTVRATEPPVRQTATMRLTRANQLPLDGFSKLPPYQKKRGGRQ
jgi:hypothetical protein